MSWSPITSFCDLFIMPNREMEDHDTEGFGLVFLEANACGKAAIGVGTAVPFRQYATA